MGVAAAFVLSATRIDIEFSIPYITSHHPQPAPHDAALLRRLSNSMKSLTIFWMLGTMKT